jgi:protein-S-isoprenylcysteine O-methyltransferase Ste14
MNRRPSHTVLLVLLALVFTVGLSFASVELPYLIDEAIMEAVPTPGFDSQADEVSRIKTELFISHYHLRAIGYGCFGAILLLIVVGFVTRRSGFAALGALAFMLPVFAQFAGVMFFLAGLGLLNVLWLPVLDVSFALSGLGAVIRAPYDALRWLLGLFGVGGYWPIVYFFIGSGLLLFFLGTLAWLQARAQRQAVAVSWVYRISRHPQYLGWIIWSYGIYLLLLQGRYPRRSWGISASLPWLISTVVIIGVAMMEELNMRKRHGEVYDSYLRSAPFLFPLPAVIGRLFASPFRALFRKERPDRRREIAAVLILYSVFLIGASSLFYGNGMVRISAAFRSPEGQRAHLAGMVAEIRQEENWRRQFALTGSLGREGEAGVGALLELLGDEDPELREYAATTLAEFPSERALGALAAAVEDPTEAVRWRASMALGALGMAEAIDALLPLLADSVSHIRLSALQALAALGAEEAIPAALDLTRSEGFRERGEGVRALGALGSPESLPALTECVSDEESWVRGEAVIALLRVGVREAIPALERAREDQDRQVRMYAAEALKRLRGT